MRLRLHNLPTRLATGGFILHSGLGKLKGGEELAKGIHGMASGAYPPLQKIEPEKFLKLLGVGEVTVGSLLLAPFVPTWLAGMALTGFSGALITMYFRTPALREPGSIWPTPDGLAISKDSWMVGIGLGLLLQRKSANS